MGLLWFMVPDEFTQARMSKNMLKLSIYGTYETNSLIYSICTFLGNQEDVIIEFAASRSDLTAPHKR